MPTFAGEELDDYLPDFQLTNSSLRKVFQLAHLNLYWFIPFLWSRAVRLASRRPQRWKQFEMPLNSMDDQRQKKSVNREQDRQRRLQLRLIKAGALLAVQMNSFFLVVYMVNLWIRLNRAESVYARIVQLVWSLNYCLVYNYMALWIGVHTMLFFCSLFHFIYRAQDLNKAYDCLIRRFHYQSSLNSCRQLAIHAQQIRFANDVLTYEQGLTLSMTSIHCVIDIFMIIYPFDLVFHRSFLFVFLASLPIPFLLMPCLIGQRLQTLVKCVPFSKLLHIASDGNPS